MATLMQTFFAWLLRNSWQTAIVVVLVLLAQRLFRNRLPPRWRCSLWLLVALRLVAPAWPESPVSIFNLLPFAPPGTEAAARAAAPAPAAVGLPHSPASAGP